MNKIVNSFLKNEIAYSFKNTAESFLLENHELYKSVLMVINLENIVSITLRNFLNIFNWVINCGSKNMMY